MRLYEAKGDLFCDNPDLQEMNSLFITLHRLYEKVDEFQVMADVLLSL